MGGAQFRWFKVDVLPVVAAVGIGVGAMMYSIGRNLLTNPEVHLTKQYRMEGVPESGTIEQRSSGYNKPSVYKSLQTHRGEKEIGEGRTRIF